MLPARRFLHDRRGVSGIEFSLILPLLVLTFFGCVTLFHYHRIGLSLDRATATVADFMSRQPDLSTSFMRDRVTASLDRLVPHEPGTLGLRVTSLVRKNNAFETKWTYPTSPGPGFAGRPLPMDLLPHVAEGDSLLLTETYVQQSALMNMIGVPHIDHRAVLAVRPRLAKPINGPV